MQFKTLAAAVSLFAISAQAAPAPAPQSTYLCSFVINSLGNGVTATSCSSANGNSCNQAFDCCGQAGGNPLTAEGVSVCQVTSAAAAGRAQTCYTNLGLLCAGV